MAVKNKPSKEELYNLYVNQKLSQRDLASN